MKKYLSENQPDRSILSEADQALIGNMFDQYKLEKNTGLYEIRNERYYYALGFNLNKVVEQLQPDYRSTLYEQNRDFDVFLNEISNDL